METRVIVADNARARIFTSSTVIGRLEEVEAFADTTFKVQTGELTSALTI